MDSFFFLNNSKTSETKVILEPQISPKSECGMQFYDAVTSGRKGYHGGHPVILGGCFTFGGD